MSESESENLVGHMAEALQRSRIDGRPEYECLISMMLEPRSPTMWNSLALTYMINGEYDYAAEAIEKSLDLETGNGWTWRIWGALFQLMGESEEAERAFRMALELDPENLRAMHQLSLLYKKRNAWEEELLLLNKLVSMRSNEQRLWDQLSECLSNLRKKWLDSKRAIE
ncbi:MAG: hypothetical protein EAX95_03910 [Candidatus Thorarchaeota archaeon]|nr:hypothetical protein [Candidatus Thorarchaeota archaeon]